MGQESVFPLKKYQDYEYPRVSILLPTLNSAQFVSTTIEQLLKQKYPDHSS
jgi:cellulose synthase/poly-beta-1,6-N-acetylglucosamine synthase-like glycosyltransferase